METEIAILHLFDCTNTYDSFIKVRCPFVQTLCIEKDSYMDAIQRVNIFR